MADRTIPRLLQTPAVVLLLFWMLVPLSMTLFFSFIRYVLNNLRRPEWTSPSIENWRGFGNYQYVWGQDSFWLAMQNSLLIVTSILFLTVILGVLIAVLIFMTSLQSEDQQQKEAATLDGASAWSQFRFLTLPHLGRPIAIVVMIQAIFHLSLYAEIEIVSRGNGNKNLPYYIGELVNNNIGAASATGIFAVILANIVAIFLLRMVGKTLME